MKNVLFVGAGALGVMYGEYIQRRAKDVNVYFVVDKDRRDRYERSGFVCNNRSCSFDYLPAGDRLDDVCADLLFFCVKTYALEEAIEAVRPYVKPETIVISVMNGISSEKMIRERLGLDYVLDGLSMGGSILRQGNQISFEKMGFLYIGTHEDVQRSALEKVIAFFSKIELPYVHELHIQKKMWEKFMVNVGNNQVASVYGADFGTLCDRKGEPYKVAHQAMAEVRAIAACHGVEITDADVEFWDTTAEKLEPTAKCSMLQDVEAGRMTEVDCFAGEVIRQGKLFGVPTPVNEMLYEKLFAWQSKKIVV